jgi:fucose 4-O-acetylase-like acetyltransferase
MRTRVTDRLWRRIDRLAVPLIFFFVLVLIVGGAIAAWSSGRDKLANIEASH